MKIVAMRKLIHYIFGVLSIISFTEVKGQDLHQSNTKYVPQYNNPAHIGSFLGNIRFTGSYRSQFGTFVEKDFSTQMFGVDAALGYGFRPNDWLGVGVQLLNDRSGLLSLSNSGVLIGLSYHLALDKKYKQVFSFGAQMGISTRKINMDKVLLESDLVPAMNLVDRERLKEFDGSYRDFNFGVTSKSILSKTSVLTIGLSMYHILRPEYNGVVLNNFLNPRTSGQIILNSKINKRWSIKPELSIGLSGKSTLIMPQCQLSYKLKQGKKHKKNTDRVFFGLGSRIGDAAQVVCGVEWKKWEVGLAYDFTISSASRFNNRNGAFEIGIYRIFEIHQKPKVIPLILCPRL